MWLWTWQRPFLSFLVTQADTVSCAPHFAHFHHAGLSCLPPLTRKPASSTPLLPSPSHTGLSLADFDLGHADDLKDPSIHQSLTHDLRTKQERFLGTSDSRDVWEWINTELDLRVVFYTLSSVACFTVPEIQKIHNSFSHWSFAFQVDGRLLSPNQKQMAKHAQRHI